MQVGICGVGISSVLSGQGSASADVTQSQILLGMALIVCSQVPTLTPVLGDTHPAHAQCCVLDFTCDVAVTCCRCCCNSMGSKRHSVVFGLWAASCIYAL